MRLSIIVAIAKGGVIGKQGGLPWYLPAELAYFKQMTMGHPIIMGRKTHESIKRALPGRENIVITRDNTYTPAEGVEVVHSLEEALEKVKGQDEAFIIGGAEIYSQALPLVNRLYVTQVDAEVEGDKFFKFNEQDWKQISSEKHHKDAKNKYSYEFIVLERKKV